MDRIKVKVGAIFPSGEEEKIQAYVPKVSPLLRAPASVADEDDNADGFGEKIVLKK